MKQAIADIRPSAHWVTAIVLILACGHRHVRPVSWPAKIGDLFDCCFCDDPEFEL